MDSAVWDQLHPVFREQVEEIASMLLGIQKLKLRQLEIDEKNKSNPYARVNFRADVFRDAFDVDPITLESKAEFLRHYGT